MDEIVRIERLGDVAVVRFDRRGRANALSFAMMDELAAAARSFEADAGVRAVVGGAGRFPPEFVAPLRGRLPPARRAASA